MLTNTAIRNAKPADKAIRLFDGGGLYLEVAPSGGKWWRLKYRFGGKEKRLSLGVYPGVSLKEARQRRDDARKLLAAGIDPADNRKAAKGASAERAANSFEVVATRVVCKAVREVGGKPLQADHGTPGARCFPLDRWQTHRGDSRP
ncbi:MAG: Arm DNA-binding domain-containing protein [Azoarcus sp.]|jgi:hypothetical protein|nr:Arm DNA-binding domain-containing protein [Azoarcus sp.]